MRLQYPDNVRLIRMPCTGRVEVRHLLQALLDGADGVFVAGCLEGDCHYIRGNIRARQRVECARGMLDEIGIGGQRVEMYNLSAGEAPRFVEIVNEMTDRIRELGPNPGKTRSGATANSAQTEAPKPS